jgi:hypothetical protein
MAGARGSGFPLALFLFVGSGGKIFVVVCIFSLTFC